MRNAGVYGIEILNLVVEVALGRGVKFCRPGALKQDFQKEREEVEVLFGWWQREWIDFEVLGFESDADVGAAEEMRKAFKASAQIEDERMRRVLLEICDQKVQQERLSRAGSPENHRVRNVSVVKIQEVGRVVIRLKNCEILLPEMPIARLATVECEEKRKVRVVRVEQVEVAEVEDVIAGNRREECVQQVVFLFVKLRVVNAEHFVELRARPVHFGNVEVIDDDGE